MVVFGRNDRLTKTSEVRVALLHGLRANEVSLECEGQLPGGRLCSRDMAFLTNGRQWISFDAAAHSGSLELALKSAMITPPPLATYTHPTCGYSFQHLEDSTVTPADEQGGCDVVVRASPNDFVLVNVGDGGFDEGADEVDITQVTEMMAMEGGRSNPTVGSWVAFGKDRWKAARKVEFAALRGLRADDVPFRMHDENGNAGLAEESRAFLTNGRRWVAVTGNTHDTDNFDIILESVRLSP